MIYVYIHVGEILIWLKGVRHENCLEACGTSLMPHESKVVHPHEKETIGKEDEENTEEHF
jgi:hypothetical protein